MRVNIYAEEITDRVEIISKEVNGQTFTGLRIYLYLPVTMNGQQYQGPFLHQEDDDDSSAVTFWGKTTLKPLLRQALCLLGDDVEQERDRLREQVKGIACEVCWHTAWVPIEKVEDANGVNTKQHGDTLTRCDFCWLHDHYMRLRGLIGALMRCTTKEEAWAIFTSDETYALASLLRENQVIHES